MDDKIREELIRILTTGGNVPEDYKEILFPTINREYELSYYGKMKKEDILRNEDGVTGIPLQKQKTFKGTTIDDSWENMLVFGDNLQLLKNIYENEDPIIKNKIKGKVKLIYIDPPFATEDEFHNKSGAKAYSDKVKGTAFIEFLRRRLILAREILAEDGTIYVHLDNKMSHYIKVIMDEVFEKNNFRNEIVWHYFMGGKPNNYFANKHDTLLVYKKGEKNIFHERIVERILPYTPSMTSNKGLSQIKCKTCGKESGVWKSVVKQDDVWDISGVFNLSNEYIDYPTQKPEELLKIIIESSTNPGDIVMDFFAGSGTTVATAEKLGRKWIACDIGKLSCYTIQKRILNISQSKSLDSNKKYNKNYNSFSTYQLGLYDLEKTLTLDWNVYKKFVSELFEFELKDSKISGISFDGVKRSYMVKIWNFNENKDSSIDEQYLEAISRTVSGKISGRIYIVAPSNNVDFLNDYFEINGIRFYFLKIPYQVIKELHKLPFQKVKQSKTLSDINNIDMAIGFHFMEQPDVESELMNSKNEYAIKLKRFYSKTLVDDKGIEYNNFDTLSSVFIDDKYDGENFKLTSYYFKDELKIEDGTIIIQIPDDHGSKIMVIYTDLFGNEFKEEMNLGEKDAR